MRAFFYTFDVGPYSRVQRQLKDEFLRLGHGATAVTREHLSQKQIEALLEGKSCVFMAFASKENSTDLLLLEATRTLDIPCIITPDTHRGSLRPSVKGLVGHCRTLVAAPPEVEQALTFGHKAAYWPGYPAEWYGYPYLQPAPIERIEGEALIFISGMKEGSDTNMVLTWCADALENAEFEYKTVISFHPGEKPETINPTERAKILQRFRKKEIHKGKGDVLFTACDIGICTGGIGTGIVGAFQRKPVIYVMNRHFEEHNITQDGVPYFFPSDPKVGACALVKPEELGEKIASLLFDKEVREALRQKQETTYPLPTTDKPPVEETVKFVLENWI